MDPLSWGTAIGGLITVVAAVIGFLRYRRGKREKLVQAEVDELKDQLAHPHTEPDPAKRLFMGKPTAKG